MFIRRLTALALALVMALPPASFASQGSLVMPTTGTLSGLTLVNDINSALDAITTCNSGATQPLNSSAAPSVGQFWCSTATAGYLILQQYDGVSWQEVGRQDTTNHIWIPQTGGGTGTIAASSTTNIGTIPQTFVTVTGSTTINSFGSSASPGTLKILSFAATPIITYNATSLILPGAVSITASAGDQAFAVYLGGGNWTVFYQRASGQAVVNPAVPIGTIIQFAGVTAPSSYDFTYGQTYSRTTFATLMGVLTSTQSVTRTSGSPTVTGFSDTTQIPAGAPIEGSGIPTSTTIVSCLSTSCTISANATATLTANVTVFPWGNGDGSTTFTLPDLRGRSAIGRDNMGGTAASRVTSTYLGKSADALGVTGGSQNHTLVQSELSVALGTATSTVTDPGHVHTQQGVGASAGALVHISVGTNAGSPVENSTETTGSSTTGITVATSITNASGGNAHAILNPLATVNYIIRVQ